MICMNTLILGGEFPYIVSTAGQAGNHSVRFEVRGSDGSSASAVISYSLPRE